MAVIVFVNLALCVLSQTLCAQVPSTPIEAALADLRHRFPNQVVIGLEELWDIQPDREPEVDLGSPNATLQQVLARIRQRNPNYRIDLIPGGLVHVYPAHNTADPAGLLDLRLPEFFLPPDDCLPQQMLYMDSPLDHFSYTPELSSLSLGTQAGLV